MALYFYTDSPRNLLDSFDAKINQKELEGKITTWERDSDGDYTHKAANWNKLAWFRPRVGKNRLTFNIVSRQSEKLSLEVYGYYHGHLTETFLVHFDKIFTSAESSALLSDGDVF